jgi:membrane fusion protein, heavy metal efflux system
VALDRAVELTEMKNSLMAFCLAGVLCNTGCGSSKETKEAAAASAPQAPPGVFVASDTKGVQTLTIASTAIPEYRDITGRVVADPTRVVHVFPAAAGRVSEMKVRPWDRVQKGQTLAIVESSDASRAVADYQKARTDSDLKKKALDRATDLFAHHAMAEKDVQQAQADAQAAATEEKTALDHLHLLGADPAGAANQLAVLAPRSGVILDIGNAAGEFSKSLDAPQPLCTIADLDTIWVQGDLFEKDLAGVKPGVPAEVTVNAYPGEKWAGRIAAIGDAVDPVTRSIQVRVELSNPQLRLKPDMFATIRMLRSSSRGLLVPAAAIEREGQSSYVFVRAGNNRFERRQVSLGRTVDGGIEVTAGLAVGDIVVSDGVVLLRAESEQ